ncbi:GNAT family N-acetyltransferase [Chengkuizengella sp. SCS-71B]|uniref:GNAT family N-acetyltransferase n=1 Tax=Chengkuizengella sp. SCS-71B TaxID=3115290 RepID=UPI0032C215EC
MVKRHFYRYEQNVTRCIVEFEHVEIGYIQFYLLDEEEKKEYGYADNSRLIYGMDQFIGEISYWNKGIGKSLVNSMIHFLINRKNADVIAMDPQTWNVRAISCYEKCGFKKKKLLPDHEWHEGKKRDCWLMVYTKSEVK